ncbi:MAG: RidA family protein [Alphaproteobacteria bacterium]|jgi:enamine deaminase RidA (YjgF/YER057c/UK114 family)|nr:RidA family protein [Alphaproteobacteria bacterium]
MTINRYKGHAAGRNRAVAHNGIVYAVATAPDKSGDIQDQTRQTLAHLDESLAMAGTDKTKMLQAQVFMENMDEKAAMDEVWNEWIGDDWEFWPQRACVGAPLSTNCLVEIILMVAVE